MSSSDLTVLRAVKEVTIGVTPATPALKQIRFTGESLNYAIENTQSAEIRPDRTETDLIQTKASGAGDINIELSFDSYKDFLAGVFCSAWGAPVSGVETLVNGVVRSSWTIQKLFSDMQVPQYHTHRGCVPEALSLTMEIGKIVEGAFTFMTFGADVTTAQIAGATLVAAPTTTPMNAVTNIQNFQIEGVPYSGCISKLSLEIKNNVRAIQCLGSLKAKNMKLGTLQVTGSMDFYFDEGSNYAAFVAGTEFDFGFDLIDSAGNKYGFIFPRAKFESGEVVAGGKNTDVMFSAKWRALYDATSSSVLTLTSAPD